MNKNTSYILMALVGLLVAGMGVYVLTTGDEEKPNTTGLLLSGLAEAGVKEGDITSVEIEVNDDGKKSKAVYSREGKGRWQCVEPLKVRVDGGAIEAIIRELLNAKVVTTGLDIPSDPAKVDLASPPVKITLRKGVDRESSVSLGTISLGQNAVAFVLSSDSPKKVQAIRRAGLAALLKPGKIAEETAKSVIGLDDLREKRLLGGTMQDGPSQAQSIRITRGKQDLALSRTPGGVWVFSAPAGYGEAEVEIPGNIAQGDKDLHSVRQLISQATNIQALEAKDFIDNPTPADLAKFGLEPGNPDAMRIELTRPGEGPGGKPETEVLYIGKPVEGNKDQVYARFEGDAAVAKVRDEAYQFLKRSLENPGPLRTRDLVRIDPRKVDAIDIETPGNKVELRRGEKETEWSVLDAAGKATNANPTFVMNLLNRLAEKGLVTEFPPAAYTDEQMGFANRTGLVKIWDGGTARDKDGKFKTPEKPAIELIFGKKDVNAVYVRRMVSGAKADFLVPLNVLDQTVNKPRVEYVDARFKGFVPTAVKKIDVKTEKVAMTLAKEGDKWSFAAPESLKGSPVDAERVDKLLVSFGALRPLKTVADAPDEAQQVRLKVDAKGAVLTVKLELADEKDKERIYYLGADSADGAGQYLKAADLPFVVEVPKSLGLSVANPADFVDRQVYKLDVAKIKAIKLTGWAGATGDKPLTREFERKDGKWTKKTELNYEIDPMLIENFLLDATNVKAEEFTGKEVKPEFGLDPAKTGLEITLDVEGGKPVTLVLGPEDTKKNVVYAKSSERGGETFTLLKDRFRGIRDSATVFMKP